MKQNASLNRSLRVMTSLALDTDHAHVAFEAFAPHYDAFTAHHDYGQWSEGLLRLAEQHGLDGHRLLDVACGTGKSALAFADRGFAVTACDHSAAMLDVARAKAGDDLTFHLSDARDLPVYGEFDLVTVLGDIVNYLLEPDEVLALLRGVRRNLAPGGLVVFDANTLWMYANFWAADPVVQTNGTRLEWRCVAGPGLEPGGLAQAQLLTTSGVTPEVSTHFQRHHPASLLVEAISDAGLEVRAVCGQFPDGHMEQPLDEARHSKGIYLAGLPSDDSEGR
jgi:ubiquinone/menaquinone biosynthesis C-methylase UbiE